MKTLSHILFNCSAYIDQTNANEMNILFSFIY